MLSESSTTDIEEHHVRTIRTAATILTIGAALAVSGSALVANAAPSNTDRNATLRLTAETEQDAFIDVGSPGPGLGDQIVSADNVFRHGQPFGTDTVICTVVKASPESITCSWIMTMALPDGQITLQGIADGPAGPPTEALSFELAVTGGTGRYRNAGGVAEIVDGPGGVEEIVLRLK